MMVNLPCLMVSRTNFLRPTCSYTECQSSSQTGSYPMDSKMLLATALVCIWFYWPSFYYKGTVISVDALPWFICWFRWWCRSFRTPFCFRVSYPEPCSIPDELWNPTRFWTMWYCLIVTPPVLTFDSFLRYLLTFFLNHIASLLSE